MAKFILTSMRSAHYTIFTYKHRSHAKKRAKTCELTAMDSKLSQTTRKKSATEVNKKVERKTNFDVTYECLLVENLF